MATQKGRNWSSGDIVTAANLSSVERGVSAVSSLYEPTTWVNGDIVTAAALNNIEQGIVNADGGGKTWVTLCEEEVTTVENKDMYRALLSYSQLISADTIRVTFDGTEYICEKNTGPVAGMYAYGGPEDVDGIDFSEYPFALVSLSGSNSIANIICTETPGTYTVKIEVLQESGSSDFSTATVTFDNKTSHSVYDIYGCFTVNGEAGDPDISYPQVEATANAVTTYNLILYKGTAGIYINDEAVTLSILGDIEGDWGEYLVTGDCTITISESSVGR